VDTAKLHGANVGPKRVLNASPQSDRGTGERLSTVPDSKPPPILFIEEYKVQLGSSIFGIEFYLATRL